MEAAGRGKNAENLSIADSQDKRGNLGQICAERYEMLGPVALMKKNEKKKWKDKIKAPGAAQEKFNSSIDHLLPRRR